MDTALVVMILLFVGGIALGMYMDWFGLWVSKDEMREEIARLAKKRLQDQGSEIGVTRPEVRAKDEKVVV